MLSVKYAITKRKKQAYAVDIILRKLIKNPFHMKICFVYAVNQLYGFIL